MAMLSLIIVAFASLILADVSGTEDQKEMASICTPANNTFTVAVDFREGHLGYFYFKECEGVHPTIGLKIGETYTFNQGDVSNWYHPMGFAYGPDGALGDQDELEPGVTRTNSSCAESLTCPAPRYKIDGNFLGDASNKEDFGLDHYEPLFFYPLLDWIGRGTFSIDVTFDDATIGQDAFYFCHIHQFMSGRIKFLDESGTPLVAENIPPLGYEYDTPGEFDRMCGTVGLDDWQLPNDACPERFVCNAEDAVDDDHALFGLCIEAMNCKMMAGMTTEIGLDPLSLFNYHMIPHHVNAVDMAKALLAFTPCDDLSKEDDPYCTMQVIAREIINTQNFQIQAMRQVLKELGAPPEDDCQVSVTSSFVQSKGTTTTTGGSSNQKRTKKEKKGRLDEDEDDKTHYKIEKSQGGDKKSKSKDKKSKGHR